MTMPRKSLGRYIPNYPRDMRVSKGYSAYDFRNTLNVSYSYDLPFGTGQSGVAGHLVSGWQLTGVVAAQGGQPIWCTAAVPALFPRCGLPPAHNLILGNPYSSIIRGGPDQYLIHWLSPFLVLAN